MEQNIPLAIVLALVASIGFASGAAIQHYAVGETVSTKHQETMGLAAMWRLVRQPRWLGGLAVLAVAAALHVVALMIGPVTVVQPVGILAVPWSILLAARIHKHKVPQKIWLWVAVTLVALGLFTWLSSLYTATHVQLHETALLLAIGVVGAVAAVLAFGGHSGPRALRCLAWASAGSVCYGLASSLIRVVGEWITSRSWMGNATFWICAAVLVVCYAMGGWMIQQGYANGPAETVVGSMTTTDPFVAVMIGLFVLGEGVGMPLWVGLSMGVLGLIAILGVALLSRDHPDAVAQRERIALQEAQAAEEAQGSGEAARPVES
jgi:drug/metabolite transporter (DMT)-like permease